MAYIPDQQINTGWYTPSTQVWDIFKESAVALDRSSVVELSGELYRNLNLIAQTLNGKNSGYYIQEEFVSGKLFYNPTSSNPDDLRPGFIKTVNTGALAAGVTNINHNIPVTNTFKWMFISGAATSTAAVVGYPIPYAAAAGVYISVSVTATQIVINNQSGVNFTDSTVTLEYVKF